MKYPIVLLLLVSFTLNAQHGTLELMTYNIKYDNQKDTVNNWNDRKEGMIALFKAKKPVIIGLQEALTHQLSYLNGKLTQYDFIGVGREDGKQKGEFSPILFDTARLKLLQTKTFWLSKTPEKISVGWDAAFERICTYGFFENRATGKQFWVFNTHFDHVGAKARRKSMRLLLQKIRMLNKSGAPVVLMGDFNLSQEEAPIQWASKKMKDGLDIATSGLEGPKGTFNGFETEKLITRRIDYVFLKGFQVTRYVHLDERLPNGKHISDHLAVLVVASY